MDITPALAHAMKIAREALERVEMDNTPPVITASPDFLELIPVLAATIALDKPSKHDILMMDLSFSLDALGEALDQYTHEEIDGEIRIIEHQLSELHGVKLTVTTPDNEVWF